MLSPGVARFSTGMLSGSRAFETPTGRGFASYSLTKVWRGLGRQGKCAESQGNVGQRVHIQSIDRLNE